MAPRISIDTLLASPSRIARPFQALPLWVLLAAVASAASSALFLESQLASRRDAEKQNLVAIADLKGGEVERWREQLERHAASVARRSSFGTALDELFRSRSAAEVARVGGQLQEVAGAEGYRSAQLVGVDGEVLASSAPAGEQRLDPELRALALAAIGHRRVAAAQLLRESSGVRVATVVPVNGEGGAPVGAVVLESPAEDAVFRGVRRWPLPSATGEIRLVRRDGRGAELLSPIVDDDRVEDLVAMLSRARAERPTAGDVAPVAVWPTEIDGRSVIAAVRPIAGTDWTLIASVDTAEVDQPIWARAGEVVATATSIFLATVIALIVAARRRAADVRAREAALERARQMARHAQLLDSTMAHELNGPLACMLTNARYALEELRRRPGVRLDDAAEALEDAVGATLRAAEVVRNLQDFAQTGARPEGLTDLRRAAG